MDKSKLVDQSLIQIKEIDELKLLFRDDCIINDKITIHQPTVREIKEFGEKDYYSMVTTLCSIPSDMKSVLYDMGIDYNTYPDFNLFVLLSQQFSVEQTRLLFGDIDFSKMVLAVNPINEEPCLVCVDENGEIIQDGIIIDRLVYSSMIQYVRKMHGIVPQVDHATNSYTRKMLVDDDRQRRERNKNKKFTSTLLPIIVSLINTEEFKYNSHNIQDIGIYELTLSFQQISKKKSAIALLQGSYSGMIDTSKINKKAFNWTYSPIEDKELNN